LAGSDSFTVHPPRLRTGMRISQGLAGEVHTVRDAIAVAHPIARREVESARACSVVAMVEAKSRAVASITVGFMAYRRRLLGGARLWQGFVATNNRTRQTKLVASGEFGPEQFAQLSARPGSEFPPEPLDAEAVVLDVPDVLRLAAERLALKGAAFQSDEPVQLVLRNKGGRHEWHLTHEAHHGFGAYVLVVDARSREITFEQSSPDDG